MHIEFVPLLHIQRELYRMPRGMDRFRAYLRTMIADTGNDLRLPPLVAMNPMGKDHLPELLDRLLAIDAESIAAQAATDAASLLRDVPGAYKLGLVVCDDLFGGWTNRYASEFTHRFPTRPMWDRGWLTGCLWSSETPSADAIRDEVQTTIFRTAYIAHHGLPRTLRDMLVQEGWVMARAGCTRPVLDEAGIAATRVILEPHLDATDMRTAIECLFGDAAAPSLGFTARGLPERAGLALALHDARAVAPCGRRGAE